MQNNIFNKIFFKKEYFLIIKILYFFFYEIGMMLGIQFVLKRTYLEFNDYNASYNNNFNNNQIIRNEQKILSSAITPAITDIHTI